MIAVGAGRGGGDTVVLVVVVVGAGWGSGGCVGGVSVAGTGEVVAGAVEVGEAARHAELVEQPVTATRR